MKKILKLATVMLIMLIVLTGCVQVNYDVKINEDGSTDISYIYGFTKEYLTTNNVNADDASKITQNIATENGYSVEKYSDDTIEGFKASKHLENVSQISLEEAFGEQYVQDTEEGKINIEKSSGKTIYSQNTTIDLTKMSGIESFVTMKYTINLPISVGKNNANEVSKDGKTLTWNLKAGEANEIKFEAIKLGAVSIIIKIILAVIIVGAIGFGIIEIIKRRKNNKVISKKIKKDEGTKEIFKEKKVTKQGKSEKSNKTKKDEK